MESSCAVELEEGMKDILISEGVSVTHYQWQLPKYYYH